MPRVPSSPRPPRRTLNRTRSLCATALALTALVAMIPATSASAAGMRRVRSPYPSIGTAPAMEAAIRSAFPAHLHRAAMNVAWCESRGRATARNGQYKGHFQIGRREWATFGRGNPYNAYDNAAAAYRYYRVAGWRPWECRP